MTSTFLLVIGFIIMAAGIADIETGWLRKIVRFPGKYSLFIAGAGIAILFIGAILQFFSM